MTTTDMTVAMTGPFDASELNWGDGSVRVSRYDVDSDSDVNSEPVPVRISRKSQQLLIYDL